MTGDPNAGNCPRSGHLAASLDHMHKACRNYNPACLDRGPRDEGELQSECVFWALSDLLKATKTHVTFHVQPGSLPHSCLAICTHGPPLRGLIGDSLIALTTWADAAIAADATDTADAAGKRPAGCDRYGRCCRQAPGRPRDGEAGRAATLVGQLISTELRSGEPKSGGLRRDALLL